MNEELTNYMFYIKEDSDFHTPHSLEIQITNAISSGNVAQLKGIFKSTFEGRLGTLSLNKERQSRYMFVTVSAVFSRAAIKGGMNYELAYSMADTYCQKMDKMPFTDDFMFLMIEMGFDFCRSVSETKQLIYSPIINKCCAYINNHTHEPVTLMDLSELCKMSTRRLSERFHKETGVPIVDYIQSSKIEEAKVLLSYTTKSIGEISSYLAFSTQSYFTQIFKKHTGYSPLQYQNIQKSRV
ncbi:MAG: helix-turn-helix domain-containing protein [Clostridiales bacterium]|nr:helix-turn-helix domain-containing protein [Clostridiales bacterium]